MEKTLIRFIGLTVLTILIVALYSCGRPKITPDVDYTGKYSVYDEEVDTTYTIQIDHIGTDIRLKNLFGYEIQGNTNNGLELTTTVIGDSTLWWYSTNMDKLTYCLYNNGSYCSIIHLTKID